MIIIYYISLLLSLPVCLSFFLSLFQFCVTFLSLLPDFNDGFRCYFYPLWMCNRTFGINLFALINTTIERGSNDRTRKSKLTRMSKVRSESRKSYLFTSSKVGQNIEKGKTRQTPKHDRKWVRRNHDRKSLRRKSLWWVLSTKYKGCTHFRSTFCFSPTIILVQ